MALGRCAQDKPTLIRMHELDGVRLIWSLLKNPSEKALKLTLSLTETFHDFRSVFSGAGQRRLGAQSLH